jgi:hypothetical protein
VRPKELAAVGVGGGQDTSPGILLTRRPQEGGETGLLEDFGGWGETSDLGQNRPGEDGLFFLTH